MRGCECTLREKGAQAVERDALHAKSTHYGTETDVP